MLYVKVISGGIGAGKTSLLHALRSSCEDAVVFTEDVSAWQFYLEKFYKYGNEYVFMLQKEVEAHFLNLTKQLEQLAEECTDKTKVAYVERSPADVLAVFLPLNKHILTAAEYECLEFSLMQFASRPVWMNATYFLLECPSGEALRRIDSRNRPGEANISREYLDRISLLYQLLKVTHEAIPLENPRNSPSHVAKIVEQIIASGQ